MKKKFYHNRTVRAWILFLLCIIFLWGVVKISDFENRYKELFLPGVTIADMSVGGKTYDEVFRVFKERAERLQEHGISVVFEGSTAHPEVNIPPSSAGLSPDIVVEYFSINDWENDLRDAYAWGREGSIFQKFFKQVSLIFRSKNFFFSADVHEEALNSLLDREFRILLKPSAPAQFVFNGNRLTISKEKAGEFIDKKEVISALAQKLATLDDDKISFLAETKEPTVTVSMLEPFSYMAKDIAEHSSITLRYGGHKWKIGGSKLVGWLTIRDGRDLGVDGQKFEDYIAKNVAGFIDNPPRNSRFKVEKGKLVEILSGKSGNAVNIGQAIGQLEKIISDIQLGAKAGVADIQIETMEVEPRVTRETIDRYGIQNLVGEISTSFKGSTADREHNIKIGVSTITGLLIAPGEEFSTVNAIGRVTEAEGYVKELVIKEDRTTKEFGGGLCQVATSLFRLALNAGLPITERVNHKFVVNYYGPGLDATIYGPHPDFRFINDTGNYLLLQGRVENGKVILELYGQKDGRWAEVSKPVLSDKIPAPKTKYILSEDLLVGQSKCFESPHEGMTANVLYTVNYPDGTVKTKNFRSVYQPWQEVCLIGTAPPSSP